MYENFFAEVRDLLITLGFSNIGVAKAEKISDDAQRAFADWIKSEEYGTMRFFENPEYQQAYVNPRKKYENAESIIAAVHPYNVFPNSEMTFKLQDKYKISRYALNIDYHKVLKEKLTEFTKVVKRKYNDAEFDVQIDAGALPEVYWAEKAGVGQRRKNGLLFVPDYGSFVFIALIITNVKLDVYSKAFNRDNICETCNRCVKSCPTGALKGDFTMDATKCVSYLTIEHKGDFCANTNLHDWIFGCDICQQVCPFNQKVLQTRDKSFFPAGFWEEITVEKLHNMSNSSFRKRLRQSPLARTGLKRLLRNIDANS